MFGSTSAWGQNNQQQQQQPQQQQGGGLFGGGGAGATTGFGQPQNTGGFGQNTAPGGFGQPAQQNTGGGLFGGGGATNTGFGGFGATAQPQQNNNAFGARPAFGATGTSTFGQQNTGGGLFGSTAANTNTGFGAAANNTGGGLFGAKPATTTFGSGQTSGLFGAKPTTTFGAPVGGQEVLKGPNELQTYRTDGPPPPPPQQGTANPAYFPTWQGDPSTSTLTAKEGPPHLFHSITGMQPYRGVSWEELRALDYQQDRKQPTAQTSTFGATGGGFGQPAAGGFGQPAASNTFGAAKPASGLFGATTGGGFGTTPSNTGGGLFGNTQNQQNSSPFGANPAPATGGGLFGQPAQQQQNPGGGLFGNTNPFGANQQQPQQQQQQAGTGTFSFGAKPTTTFGATGSTGFSNTPASTFGQTPAPATNTFGGFGQNTQQGQQPATGGGLFGGGGFGTTSSQPAQPATTGGLFGQTQQPGAAQSTFGAPKPGGLFGSNPTPAAGSTFNFGSTPSQPAATGGLFGNTNAGTNTGGGLFGQPQQQNAQQPAAPGGGLFGGGAGGSSLFAPKPAAPAAGGGMFGQPPATQPPAQSSLFGNAGHTGSGLFGNSSALGQQNQQQPKPATGGLFGGGGLFGQQNQQQQPQQTGTTGGLFGNLGQSQPAPSNNLFGGQSTQQTQQPALSGSLFGSTFGQSTAQQPPQQQSLTASIDQNPYGNNQLFAYNGQKLELGSQSKKPALPPLTASAYRLTPSKSQVSRLRGFASPLNGSQSPARSSTPLNGLGSSGGRSILLNSPAAPDRYKGLTDTALTPNAFVPRPSIKKLTVTPKVPASNSEDRLESVLGKSALKGSNGSLAQPTPERTQLPARLLFNQSTNGNAPRQPEAASSPARRPAPVAESSPRVAGSERQPKKGEYWCKPRMEKLKQLSRQELSELHNFTAGRRGYGEVTFLEPVDLTSVPFEDLLGTVIVFDQSELSVYPDDYPSKAPQGEGLNVPAQITLEHVYSHDKATKEPVTDTKDPRYVKFLKRVKSIPNTEFVSYTDDGTWTFKVEHFSRYGIDDSDEDDEPPAKSKALPQKLNGGSDRTPSRTPESEEEEDEDEDMLPPTKSIHDVQGEGEEHDSGLGDEDDYEDDEEYDEDEEEDSFEDADLPQPSWDQPIKAKVGPEGMRKLREMQSSFFGQAKSRSAYTTAMDFEKGKKRVMASRDKAFFGDAEEDVVELDADRAVKRTSFGDNVSPPPTPKLRQPRKYAKIAQGESVVQNDEGVRIDSGLALGRSFRASWGPSGELVHIGKITAPGANFVSESQATLLIEKIEILADNSDVESRKAKRLLSLHLERTIIDSVDGVPFAAIDTTTRFRDFSSRFDAGDRSHEASVFRLGVALFDEIDLKLPSGSSEDLVQRIASIRRKLALSSWLEDAVAPSVDSDLIANGEDKAAKVFTLLSGHQVERAVQSALDGGDMRLATLISQAGGEEIFRGEVMKQLEDWQKYKANPLIGKGYRKLYALLAGITDISPGDPSRGADGCPDVLIAENLDWKRAFGLQMWYGTSFENTISEVLSTYLSALSSSHPPAQPLPLYLEKPNGVGKKWNSPTEPTDILFGLINLYSDITISLEQILNSRDTSSSPLDNRLAWHLYILLSRILEKRDFEDREEGYSRQADILTQGYASQLELSGEWRWAAFVLLHLETPDGREKALRDLIFRHPNLSTEDENFLVGTLHIPLEWIHQSRAAQFASDGDAWNQYHSLVEAGLYDQAHKTLLDKLAPEAVVRDDRVLLRKICGVLEGKGVDGWEYGGKLLLDWADLTTDTNRLLSSVLSSLNPDPRELSTLTQRANSLPRVIQLLPALFAQKQKSRDDELDLLRVAGLSEMLSPLYHLSAALHSAGYIQRQPVSSNLVDEDRLHLLQGAAYDNFNKSLESIPVAA